MEDFGLANPESYSEPVDCLPGSARNRWQWYAALSGAGHYHFFHSLTSFVRTGLYSLTMIILPEVSPAKFRQALGGVIGIVVAVGGVLGPVLGGMPPRVESPFPSKDKLTDKWPQEF